GVRRVVEDRNPSRPGRELPHRDVTGDGGRNPVAGLLDDVGHRTRAVKWAEEGRLLVAASVEIGEARCADHVRRGDQTVVMGHYPAAVDRHMVLAPRVGEV